MSSINQRIQTVVNKMFNGNVSEFERISGIKPYTVKNIVGSRQTKPSYDVLESIIRNNVQISSEWLLTGQGPMLKQTLPSSLSMDSSIGVGHIGNNSSPIIQNQAHSQSLLDKKSDPIIIENKVLKFEVEQLKKDNSQLKEDVNFFKKQIEELKLQNQDLQNRLLEEKDRFINYITQNKS